MNDFQTALRRMREVRRSVPVQARLDFWALSTYRCRACGVSQRVALCLGIGGDEAINLPAPAMIECTACDEPAMERVGTLTPLSPSETPRYVGLPYVRVPSRRAALDIAQSGRAEGQLVVPFDPLLS